MDIIGMSEWLSARLQACFCLDGCDQQAERQVSGKSMHSHFNLLSFATQVDV